MHPITIFDQLTSGKGRLHDQLGLHYLATLGLEGAIRRNLRFVPRLEVLPSARQVCATNARGLAVSQFGGKMGLGSGEARSIA
jgi:hypothetical protein